MYKRQGQQGVPVPGLDGGNAPAAAGPKGVQDGLEHGRVGAVAQKGVDPRLDAGGHQSLVVLLVGVPLSVVELHRPHRPGKDGQGIGPAEQGNTGVGLSAPADGVHVQIPVSYTHLNFFVVASSIPFASAAPTLPTEPAAAAAGLRRGPQNRCV